MEAFLAHIRGGQAWSERRPRQLLRWADRYAIPVFGARRFVPVLNAGFACPQQWRLWRAAKVELRRARAAIARGEESAMAYAGDRGLLAFAESGPRRWGAPDSVLWPSLHASLVAPPPETSETTSSSPPGPQLPRGQWITRA